MAKRFNLKIEECNSCPYVGLGLRKDKTTVFCTERRVGENQYNARLILEQPITLPLANLEVEIPEWCPLEDWGRAKTCAIFMRGNCGVGPL